MARSSSDKSKTADVDVSRVADDNRLYYRRVVVAADGCLAPFDLHIVYVLAEVVVSRSGIFGGARRI